MSRLLALLFSADGRFEDKEPNCGIGINILLYGKELGNSISFVSCGLLEGERKLDHEDFNLLYIAEWVKEDVYMVAILEPTRSINKTTSVYGKNTVYNYFISFYLISGSEEVDSLILHPLSAMYERKMSDADCMVFDDTLKAEDLS